MDNKYTREVVELHQFFEVWFKGELSQNEANYAQFVDVIGVGFVIINPDGTVIERDVLTKGLYAGHGSRPNFRLWIENAQIRHHQGDITVITYEEWQDIDDKITTRMSTAIFQEDTSARNGVIWLQVHETWMPNHHP